jgi:hypothetical protein
MKHIDALHILGLSAKYATLDNVKNAYRKACSLYHPDRNPAGGEMMKLVNIAYDELKAALQEGGRGLDKSVLENTEAEGAENYGSELNAAINAIIHLGLTIEICGAWIWVSGDTRPHKDILKQAGYKWAPVKAMWHYRPKEWKSASRGNWDIDKIRARHGSQEVRRKQYTAVEQTA